MVFLFTSTTTVATTVAITVTWISSTYKNKELPIVFYVCFSFVSFSFAENLLLECLECRLKTIGHKRRAVFSCHYLKKSYLISVSWAILFNKSSRKWNSLILSKKQDIVYVSSSPINWF